MRALLLVLALSLLSRPAVSSQLRSTPAMGGAGNAFRVLYAKIDPRWQASMGSFVGIKTDDPTAMLSSFRFLEQGTLPPDEQALADKAIERFAQQIETIQPSSAEFPEFAERLVLLDRLMRAHRFYNDHGVEQRILLDKVSLGAGKALAQLEQVHAGRRELIAQKMSRLAEALRGKRDVELDALGILPAGEEYPAVLAQAPPGTEKIHIPLTHPEEAVPKGPKEGPAVERAPKGALALDPATLSLAIKIKMGFETDRNIEFDKIPPGSVITDIGRHAQVASAEGLAKANIDHHQLPRGKSATLLVWENRDTLAAAGQIRAIHTHADPDFDAMASAMLVHAIKEKGRLPEGIKPFVDYINGWDSGSLTFSNLQEMRHSLGFIVMGITNAIKKQVDGKVTAQVLKEFGLANFGQVFDPGFNEDRGAFFQRRSSAMKQAGRDQLTLEKVSQFVSALMADGYRGEDRGWQVLESDVPEAFRALYKTGVQGMAEELENFSQELSRLESFEVRLPSEAEGQDMVSMKMALSMNTKSDFHSYLYATGIMAGTIYKDMDRALYPNELARLPKVAVDSGKLQSHKVVIAISEQAGASLKGLSAALNVLEIKRRKVLGLSDRPAPPQDPKARAEVLFWKEGVPDKLIVTTEGSVLSKDELAAALKRFPKKA